MKYEIVKVKINHNHLKKYIVYIYLIFCNTKMLKCKKNIPKFYVKPYNLNCSYLSCTCFLIFYCW